MPSSLNPTVKPFPALIPQPIAPPGSSPTTTSYSSNSTIDTRVKSSNGTYRSSSDRDGVPTTPFPHVVLSPASVPVKSFGHGWNSTPPSAAAAGQGANRNAHAHSVSLLDTPPPVIIPSRARSPSAPTLNYSQPQAYVPASPQVHSTRSSGVPFPTTGGPRRIPSNYQLNHHPSVPSLVNDYDETGRFTPTIGREREVSRWRQNVAFGLHEPVEEEGSGEDISHSQAHASPNVGLTAHRSVPALTAPTLPNGYTQSRNIYIPSLPAEWREMDLHKFASQFGRITSIKLEASVSYPPTASRAFVMFHEIEAALAFYGRLREKTIPCEIAKEDFATVYKSLEDPESANLYIQGFLPTDTMDFCQQVLHPGVIESHSRPTDAQGRLRGILMARLESRPQADEAILRLNDRFVHPVTGNKLQVRIADSDRQKAYKRENDLNRSDRFSSMPDMRHSAPKVVTFNYNDEREWMGRDRGRISRESSYASIRSPTSSTFPFAGAPAPAAAAASGQVGHEYGRHKPSNLSLTAGTGGDWSSRTGWTNTAGNNLWPEIDESTVHF